MPAPYGGQSQQRWGDNTINANEYLRDLMLTDMSGRPIGTSDARRKGMLVLAFFNADSPASQELLPYLQRLADGYKDANKLTVMGVSQNNREVTKALLDKLGVKFPVVIDFDLYHTMIYGLVTVPAVFLADNTGLVVRKMNGLSVNVLNDMSAKIAQFAGVEAIDVTKEFVPAPPPPPAAAPAA